MPARCRRQTAGSKVSRPRQRSGRRRWRPRPTEPAQHHAGDSLVADLVAHAGIDLAVVDGKDRSGDAASSPARIKTTGTIRLTSTPIRRLASGLSAIARSARPVRVRFSRCDRPTTIASASEAEKLWQTDDDAADAKIYIAVWRREAVRICTVRHGAAFSMISKKPSEETSGIACSVASP